MIDIENGQLLLFRNIFSEKKANNLFQRIKEDTPWRQEQIKMFGRWVTIPRQQAWYGESGTIYSYSGLSLEPINWTAGLLSIKEKAEYLSAGSFNSVLINRYRNGQDSMGWHSDDEPELGINPVIASISFGSERYFSLQHRKIKAKKLKFLLPHNSLLLMSGELQHFWRHQLPKTRAQIGERINLTFRNVIRDEKSHKNGQ